MGAGRLAADVFGSIALDWESFRAAESQLD